MIGFFTESITFALFGTVLSAIVFGFALTTVFTVHESMKYIDYHVGAVALSLCFLVLSFDRLITLIAGIEQDHVMGIGWVAAFILTQFYLFTAALTLIRRYKSDNPSHPGRRKTDL